MACTLFMIVVLVLLLGPLRPWAGRHWAFLTSVALGIGSGYLLGTFLTRYGLPALTPVLGALAGAVALGDSLPVILRQIEKDGRD